MNATQGGDEGRRVVDLTTFSRISGLSLESLVDGINRGTFTRDKGLVMDNRHLAVDVDAWNQSHRAQARRKRRGKK